MTKLPIALVIAAFAATSAAAPAPSAALTGWLEAHERDGCGSGGADGTLRTRFEGTQAIFEQDVWLSSREWLEPLNTVGIEREGDTLFAQVPVHVEPVVDGQPVPACIRAVHVILRVDGLAEGDYQVLLRRASP